MSPALQHPDEFDPALMRHPTPEEKEQELRLYYIARGDALPSTGGIIRMAAQATWRLLKLAREAAPELYDGYWNAPAQPKICLKVKNSGQLLRAIEAVGSTPHVIVPDESGAPLFAAFGPACRAMMPDHLRKLQILQGDAPASPIGIPVEPAETVALRLFVRTDVATPYGKLAAQAGHGAWAALKRLLAANPWHPAIAQWDAARNPVLVHAVPDLEALAQVQEIARAASLNAAFIVDAGRTAFKEPTATVVGLGPVAAVPDSLSSFPEIK